MIFSQKKSSYLSLLCTPMEKKIYAYINDEGLVYHLHLFLVNEQKYCNDLTRR